MKDEDFEKSKDKMDRIKVLLIRFVVVLITILLLFTLIIRPNFFTFLS